VLTLASRGADSTSHPGRLSPLRSLVDFSSWSRPRAGPRYAPIAVAGVRLRLPALAAASMRPHVQSLEASGSASKVSVAQRTALPLQGIRDMVPGQRREPGHRPGRSGARQDPAINRCTVLRRIWFARRALPCSANPAHRARSQAGR